MTRYADPNCAHTSERAVDTIHWTRFCQAVTGLGILILALYPAGATAQTASVTTVEQIGADSLAIIAQGGGTNDTRITQSGTNLTATISLRGNANAQGANPNEISQTGAGSVASVDVLGDRNAFSVRQSGGVDGAPAGNIATLAISGSDNIADISQDNRFGATFGNVVSIDQIGAFNVAQIDQTVDPTALGGGLNTATIRQTGDGNQALIAQRGAGNTAAITQEGSDNFGSLTQDGDGYTAELSQFGEGLSYSITQSPCLIGAGACTDATISVIQTSGGLAVPLQSGG